MDLKQAIEVAGEGEVWLPQPDEYLIGRVLALRRVETEYGERMVVDILDEETGIARSLFLTSVLHQRFDDYGVEVGDRVAIKYHGKRKGKKREYHSWTVLVEKAPRAKADKGAGAGLVDGGDGDGDYGDDEESPF